VPPAVRESENRNDPICVGPAPSWNTLAVAFTPLPVQESAIVAAR